MDLQETKALLTLLANVDRREVDLGMAQGWTFALQDVPFAAAQKAVYRIWQAGGYVDVKAIRGQLAYVRNDLERDVRSAKARGIVPASWPAGQALPSQLEAKLREAQNLEWALGNDRPEDLVGVGKRIDLGLTLKSPDEVAS